MTFTTDPLVLLAALLLGVLATARATRLVVHDSWPPMMTFRAWVVRVLVERWHGTGEAWSKIVTCPFCFAPYAAAVNLAWFLLADAQLGLHESGWAAAWWVVNLWAAIAYLAAIVVVWDEPAE